MRASVTFFSAILLIGLTSSFASQQESRDKAKQTQSADAEAPIPQQDVDMKNPVKPTTEGLAGAKKLYGYHCAMCHGENGDGKGDLAEQMKLNLSDWRNPATLSKYTDGALFYIVTNGRGKMVGGEGDRTKEEVRWNLVNLVRAFAKKTEEPAKP